MDPLPDGRAGGFGLAQHPGVDGPQHPVAEPSGQAGQRRDAETEGGQVATGERQGDDPGDHDRRTLIGRQLGQQGSGQEQRVHDHRVDRRRGQQLGDGGVLPLARADEDVLDVEGDGREGREAFALGEASHDIAVVEVRLRREGDVRGSGGGHGVGEAGSGEEPYGVAPRDQVGRDGQQRGDVPVDRDGGDEIARHDGLLCGMGPLVRFGTGLVY